MSRRQVVAPAASTDTEVAQMIHSGHTVSQIRRRLRLTDDVIWERAEMMGLDDLLSYGDRPEDHRRQCAITSDDMLAALNAAYPGGSYRDVAKAPRDIRPATNPPILKFAA